MPQPIPERMLKMAACKCLLALAVQALVLVSLAPSASAQGCNAGVQYFSLEGYKTAAVFADGVMMLPSDLFGDQAPLVIRALERRNLPTDIISVGNNILYLETNSERIIFDTGNGPGGEATGFLLPSLEAQGIPADSITHVLLTHGHPDHVSGLVLDSNGTQAFPSATVYVSRVEFEYWMMLEEDSAASEIFDQIESQIELFEFGDEVLPNITAARNASWHTPGSVIFSITAADNTTLYYAGDAITNEVFAIAMPYIPFIFDLDQSAGVTGRIDALDLFVETKSLLITTHTSFPPLGTVLNDGLYFELMKIPPQFAAGVGTTCSA
eukprot:jgi/Ulvmu1/11272/UM073_0044.1